MIDTMIEPSADIYDAVLAMPCGAPFAALGVRLAADPRFPQICELEFLPTSTGHRIHSTSSPAKIELLETLTTQVKAYLADPDFVFDLPLALIGTPFRQRVWRALREIPVRRVMTYGALAKQLGSSPRAVGQALGDNPIPLVVPCHRVVGVTGLGGFMHTTDDFPLRVKRGLLRHEGALDD